MSTGLKEFLQRWVISTVAVLVATYIVPGITYQNWFDLLIATFVLGILNTFLRPLLLFVSLPLLIFTLGLFTFIINALLLYFVGYLLKPKFSVDSFAAAFWGALVITIVSLVLNSLTGTGGARIKIEKGKPPPQNRGDDGGGPVIDV
jgi:putative membrane protein